MARWGEFNDPFGDDTPRLDGRPVEPVVDVRQLAKAIRLLEKSSESLSKVALYRLQTYIGTEVRRLHASIRERLEKEGRK